MILKDLSDIPYEDALKQSKDLYQGTVGMLIFEHDFVGYFLQNLKVTYGLDVPTLGVSFDKTNFRLHINPYFMLALDKKEVLAVVRHEVFHLVSDHLARIKKEENFKLQNISADLAINQHIPNLPSVGKDEYVEHLILNNKITKEQALKHLSEQHIVNNRVQIGMFPEMFNFPRNLTSEQYFELLKKEQEKQKKEKGDKDEGQTKIYIKVAGNNQGEGDLDSHEGWTELDGLPKEIVESELQRILGNAKDSCKNYGSLPQNIQTTINDILYSKINWRAYFRGFVQRAGNILKERTRMRPNRRFGITYPGNKNEFKLNISLYIDTSGSMSEKDLQMIASEVNKMLPNKDVEITVNECDTEIHRTTKLKKPLTRVDTFMGRGGTLAHVWLEHANKSKSDVNIVLTDGWFGYELPKTKKPTLWVLTKHGVNKEEFKRQAKQRHVIVLEE
jgi:predicted metal-dependent peptidase